MNKELYLPEPHELTPPALEEKAFHISLHVTLSATSLYNALIKATSILNSLAHGSDNFENPSCVRLEVDTDDAP